MSRIQNKLPLRLGTLKLAVLLTLPIPFLVVLYVLFTKEASSLSMAAVLVVGVIVVSASYHHEVYKNFGYKNPLRFLAEWRRRNFIGYKLEAKALRDGDCIDMNVFPRKVAVSAHAHFPVVVSLPLGGWFHKGKVCMHAPTTSADRWVASSRMVEWWNLNDPNSVILVLEGPVEGEKCLLRLPDALNVLRLVYEHEGRGGISVVLAHLLQEHKEHNQETTQALLDAVMKAADELADSTRVGRSKDGKRIRERLDRVALKLLSPGSPEYVRISRRLEK